MVRFVAEPGGSIHGAGVLGIALFQEPDVCADRRPFRFRPGPLFGGRQQLQGRVGMLAPWQRRAGLVGVFGLSADGGGSLHGRPGRIIGLRSGMGQDREPARPGLKQAGQSL